MGVSDNNGKRRGFWEDVDVKTKLIDPERVR